MIHGDIHIGIDEKQMELSIISGIDSAGYERALRRSGDDAFVDIVLSTYALRDDLSKYAPKETDENEWRPWVALWFLLLGGCLAIFLTYHRKRCNCTFSKKMQVEDHSLEASQVTSPNSSIGHILTDNGVRMHSSGFSTSDTSQENNLKYREEHPLTGIVPPMILYENIDEYPHEQSTFSELHNVFPSRRAIASPVLLAQFKSGTVTIDETMVSVPPTGTGLIGHASDDKSVSSLPPGMLKNFESIQGRDLDAIPPKGHRISISLDKYGRPPRIPGLRASNHHLAILPFMTDDVATLPYSNGIAPRGLFETPESKYKTPSARLNHSEPKPKRSWPGMHNISHASSGSTLRIASISTTASPSRVHHMERKGEKRTFQVSRYGKLGFVFRCDPSGPVVQQVKDYSPLLGKAKKGDRLINIDGWDTHGATHEDVSAMIAKKANPTRLKSSMIDIVFFRERSKEEKNSSTPSLLEFSKDQLSPQRNDLFESSE